MISDYVVTCSVEELKQACKITPGWFFKDGDVNIGNLSHLLSSTEGYTIFETSITYSTGVEKEEVLVRVLAVANYWLQYTCIASGERYQRVLMAPFSVRANAFAGNTEEQKAEFCRNALNAFPALCQSIANLRK